MNFCGGAVDQQVVEGGLNGASVADDAVGVTINPLQCGGCVKGVDSRDDEPAELGPITDSSDDGSTAAETPEETPSAALDVIQEALDEGPTSAPFATPSRPVARQSTATLEQTPKSSRELASVYTASPSPYFLNPLNTEWKDATSASVPPPLPLENSSSSPLKSLMQRLEEGFGVRLTGGPISLLAGEEDVWLYLHRDRSRLCVESSTKIRRRSVVEKKEAVDCWVEIPMNEILRLEIGGGTKNPRSFSIVTEKESNRLVYYDFETKSAIDREVLVSTLVVVLDQRSKQGDSFDWTGGGTRDQPIPCSPSLEEQEKSIPSSPSLQHGGTLYSASQQSYGHLSPRKRTQIFNGDQETETSLVIHVEDLVSFESDTSRFGSDWARRHELPLPHTSLQQRSHASNLDMLIVDEQDECRSDYKDPSLSCSTALTTGAWCAQDICTLALNDIADACLSIFAMRKHADAFCTNLASAEQLTIIEEHIASALGAPTEIYAQVMQSDIWNIPPAVSNLQTEPKDTFVVRNRASQLNAQAARLRGLRNEMTFAAALRQSRERMHFVQTVRSFDDAYSNSGVSRKLRAATEAADRFHSSPLLQRLVEDLAMHDLDGDAAGKDEVAYYDSDPEDVRPRTIRRGPRRVAAERFNCKKEEEENENQGQHQRALSGGLFDELGSSGKLSRKLDEDTIIEIVHVRFLTDYECVVTSVWVMALTHSLVFLLSFSLAAGNDQRKTDTAVASDTIGYGSEPISSVRHSVDRIWRLSDRRHLLITQAYLGHGKQRRHTCENRVFEEGGSAGHLPRPASRED
jgi:hypothetical protein